MTSIQREAILAVAYSKSQRMFVFSNDPITTQLSSCATFSTCIIIGDVGAMDE